MITKPEDIKKKIEELIELLPIVSQADYELALLGIELQEELYSQCKNEGADDKIRKRLEAFELLIELRQDTKKLLTNLGENQVVMIGNKAKGLREIIKQKQNANNESAAAQSQATGTDQQ